MPVTTRAAPVEVKPVPKLDLHSAESILQLSTEDRLKKWKINEVHSSILSSSFDESQEIQPAQNGFVSAVLDAYIQHNHLVLRPEDVWFAILTQFSFYVNKHAEELRSYFVEHKEKKKLEIVQDRMDLETFALKMTDLIAENVKDPGLREWIMPSFSTTTRSDEVAAAIIMMGTMEKYFCFFDKVMCGIPSVTLLGKREDWADILQRLAFLTKFEGHEELLLWNSVLTPIVTKFVQTFDEPDGKAVVRFWQTAVHQYKDDYSGQKRITGWIQAFCFWDPEGTGLNASGLLFRDPDWREKVKTKGHEYWLDAENRHAMDWEDVPAGYTYVPVHMDVIGDKFKALAVAGSVGWKIVDSESVFAETRSPQEKEEKESDSTLTGSTLTHNPSSKTNFFKPILRALWCFRPRPPPRIPFHTHEAPQISELEELKRPWDYESGGKNDSLQPVTGWWVARTSEGTYGRDDDCPDVQFDRDAFDYDPSAVDEAIMEVWNNQVLPPFTAPGV